MRFRFVYIVLFIVFLAAPIGAMLLSFESRFPGRFNDLRESQKLSFPDIDWRRTHIDKGFQSVERWYNDNFGFRNELVKMNAVAYRSIGVSPNTFSYLQGKNGFIFMGNSGEHAVDVSSGDRPFTGNELEQYFDNLQTVRSYFENQGIPFYIIIAPSKHTVYPEYLPGFVPSYKPTRHDQIIGYESNPLGIIDVRNELIKGKEQFNNFLYYKTDSHWTLAGAYLGYRKLMDVIIRDFPGVEILEVDTIELEDDQVGGDLAYKANLINQVHDFDVYPVFKKPVDSLKFFYKPGVVKTQPPLENVMLGENLKVVNKNKELRVLFIHDSFGRALGVFLNHTFGKVKYLYSLSTEADDVQKIIDAFSPDLVIFEFVERYLNKQVLLPEKWHNLLDYKNAKPLIDMNGSDILSHLTHKVKIKILESDHQSLKIRIFQEGHSALHFRKIQLEKNYKKVFVRVSMYSPYNTISRFFYLTRDQKNYNEENSMRVKVQEGWNDLLFTIDKEYFNGSFRLDPGYKKGEYLIKSIEVRVLQKTNNQ